MIETRDLAKRYGDRIALEKISLTFGDRGLVCITGPSGCGKTTLLNMIGGLDKPTGGVIAVNGRDISVLSERELNAYRGAEVGFVFQKGNLLKNLTVRENIAYPSEVRGICSSERSAAADNALGLVGLSNEAEKFPSELSGGQYQRIAVARGIAGDPSLILADEPTGALDEEAGNDVMRLLKELSAERLVIVVTHNIALAEKYADRMIGLRGGSVVTDTAPQSSELPFAESIEGKTDKTYKKNKISYKSATAFGFRTLSAKRMRTLITSIACAVGIFGVSAVLALSTLLSVFVRDTETDLLSTYAVSAGEAYDLTTFLDAGGTLDISRLDDAAYVRSTMSDAYFRLSEGKSINGEYVDYIENLDKSTYRYIDYDYLLDYSSHIFVGARLESVELNVSFDYISEIAGSYADIASALLDSVSYFSRLPSDHGILENDCTLVYGSLPSSANELVLVLDADGCIDDYVMAMLGYYSIAEITEYLSGGNAKREWSYAELASRRFAFFDNDIVYTKGMNGRYTENTAFGTGVQSLEPDEGEGLALKISGIVRDNGNAAIAPGVYYTAELDEYFMRQGAHSAIVKEMRALRDAGRLINPLTGASVPENIWTRTLRSLGGDNVPNTLNIYAASVEAKDEIVEYLAAWNTAHPDFKINYADNVSTVIGYVSSVLDGLTIGMLLLAFAALVVAAVMLGAVTYVSVGSRMSELGVMRSLGASREYITVSVLTESGFVGLFGGFVGLVAAYIALAVCSAFLPVYAGLLLPWQAVTAIAASTTAACVAGLPPAIRASKADPAETVKEI